jgi:hypothetical protein
MKDKCIEFRGFLDNDGYGMLYFQKKTWRAHRLSWTIVHGEIPKGMFICHTCDNPSCININHLFLGTPNDNVQDMISKGRKVVNSSTSHYNCKLTDNQVREIRERYSKGGCTQKKLWAKSTESVINT